MPTRPPWHESAPLHGRTSIIPWCRSAARLRRESAAAPGCCTAIRTAEVDSRRLASRAFVDKLLEELREGMRALCVGGNGNMNAARRALIPKYRQYHRPIVRLHAR